MCRRKVGEHKMKIKEKTKDCHLTVNVNLSMGENINEMELNRFANLYLRGFLKPRLIKKKKIEYTGPVGVSLYNRMQKPITKRDFMYIIEQLVVAARKLKANQLPIYHLEMNIHNVFINELTKEIQFLYIPLIVSQNEENLIELIKSIIYSAKVVNMDDADFISRFAYFFNGLKPFNGDKIEEFIAREDRGVVNTISKQNAGQSGFMTNKQQHYYEHYNNNHADSVGDEPTGLLGDDDVTGLLIENEDDATGLLLTDDGAETGLLNENEYQGVHTMPQQMVSNEHCPTLLRVLTNETIRIDKIVYRIGKEKSCVDYPIADNLAISRKHVDIITRGNRYFVKDLNSKNFTYMNEQQIQPQCEVEIYDGCHLRLGDEEFVFHV